MAAEPGGLEPGPPGSSGQRACLLLVCGLPGCGKSSFCQALRVRLAAEPALLDGPVDCRHLSYDAVEAELRGPEGSFDPAVWRAAREEVTRIAGELLQAECPSRRRVLLLDDNMYYRSMRKRWYHLALEHGCAFRQLFLSAPEAECLARNRQREAACRVPDFSIRHMAEVFQWPRADGESWEARELVSLTLDACSATTEGQVEAFLQHWRCREGSFWMPLPPRDEPQAEAQSEAHSADVALRRVVSRAISEAPPELGEARGALSKKWSKRKAELVKELSAELKVRGGASADELINGAEILFMRSCVADVQRAAAELRG